MPEIELQSAAAAARTRTPGGIPITVNERLQRAPWWALALAIGGFIIILQVLTNETYRQVLNYIGDGIAYTILISVVAYTLALILGLFLGLGRVARNPVIYNIATLYVEVVRGVPLLVLLLYINIIVAPALVNNVPQVALPLGLRDALWRAIYALALGYAAYLGEVYRAGIEAVPRGQSEAAASLGMSRFQMMRYVILPQAIRTVLPALANDFIAMIKDSSLASVIAVSELTYLTRLNQARTFTGIPNWNMAALLYLIMTLVASLGVRFIERRNRTER